MLNCEQFKNSIIIPSTSLIKEESPEATELLVFTCAVESAGGTYIRQVNGPALGIYQMKTRTYNDVWQTYIRHQPHLLYILGTNLNIYSIPDETRLIYDLYYATIMARIFYLGIKEKIPSKDDIDEIYNFYKKYYNTNEDAPSKVACIKAYQKFTNGSGKKAKASTPSSL